MPFDKTIIGFALIVLRSKRTLSPPIVVLLLAITNILLCMYFLHLKLSVFFFRVAIRIIVLTISFNINKWEEGLLKTGVLLTFIT